MVDPTELSLVNAAERIRKGVLSPVTYLEACLERIQTYDPHLNAFISLDPNAHAAARAAGHEIAAGQWRGPLHGVPVAIKDLFDVAGQCTSAHSRIRMDHVAAADSHVVRKLREAGAIILGKTALHEFATGGPSFDLPWPPARNPWKTTHHPGGSSSGSGVAVAAGMVPVAIGTDTGGSVRNPATACGIMGAKPTYGTIGRSGAFPLAFSLDHVGVLTRHVEDNVMALQALFGKDPADPSSVAHPQPVIGASLGAGIKGLRIGIFEEFNAQASQAIRDAFSQVCACFEREGATLVPLELSPLADYVDCGRLILQAEAFAVHEPWLRTRIGEYGQRGRTRLLPGAFLSATDYIRAQQLRTELQRELVGAMEGVDAAICLSSLELPCVIDDEGLVDRTYDRQARTPFNLTGNPAISMPMGFSDGLPMGFQIVAKHFDEAMMYRVAQAFESVTDWHMQRPPLEALRAS